MAHTPLNRQRLISRLGKMKFRPLEQKQEEQDQLHLGASVLRLAGLEAEQEHELCRAVAKHLLGEVPEPNDKGLPEDI